MCISILPVSYTHLDVYKRQGRSAHLAGQYSRTDRRRGIDYFWHCIIGVFCDETDRLFGKEAQNKKRKSAESQKKT